MKNLIIVILTILVFGLNTNAQEKITGSFEKNTLTTKYEFGISPFNPNLWGLGIKINRSDYPKEEFHNYSIWFSEGSWILVGSYEISGKTVEEKGGDVKFVKKTFPFEPSKVTSNILETYLKEDLFSKYFYENNAFEFEEISKLINEIRKNFKKISSDTYLIKEFPESKQGFTRGGMLTVYLPQGEEMGISIFDRTDKDFNKWFNVSNFDSSDPRRARETILLGKHIPPDKRKAYEGSQEKFDKFISEVKELLVKNNLTYK